MDTATQIKNRKSKRKIRYACRQAFAKSRPRIGGRFASKEELSIILNDPELSRQLELGQSIHAADVKAAAAAQQASGTASSEPNDGIKA